MCFTMAPTLSTRFINEKYYFFASKSEIKSIEEKTRSFLFARETWCKCFSFLLKRNKNVSRFTVEAGIVELFSQLFERFPKYFIRLFFFLSLESFYIVLSADISRLVNEIFTSFTIFSTKFQFHKTRRFFLLLFA